MATYSRTEQVIEGGSDFSLLPSGKYIMRITDAKEVENRFGKPNRDGSKKMQVMIRWELSRITAAQQTMINNVPGSDDFDDEQPYLESDEAIEVGESSVLQYMTPLYATIKDRDTGTQVPTPWKTFVDTLADQDIIGDEFDLSNLLGVEQLVTVNKEPKKQGDNAGKMGNKVAKIGPVPTKKAASVKRPTLTQEEESEIPF